jgi:hypothetical protein
LPEVLYLDERVSRRKEVMKMGSGSEALRYWAEHISTDWEQIGSWAQRVFVGKRIGAVVLLTSTITVLAGVLFSLYRTVQCNAIAGIAPYLPSLN